MEPLNATMENLNLTAALWSDDVRTGPSFLGRQEGWFPGSS